MNCAEAKISNSSSWGVEGTPLMLVSLCMKWFQSRTWVLRVATRQAQCVSFCVMCWFWYKPEMENINGEESFKPASTSLHFRTRFEYLNKNNFYLELFLSSYTCSCCSYTLKRKPSVTSSQTLVLSAVTRWPQLCLYLLYSSVCTW